MLKVTARVCVGLIGIVLLFLGSTTYFTTVVSCLKGIKEIAEYAVPTILALATAYQIASSVRPK
jgi:hypothetical protein